MSTYTAAMGKHPAFTQQLWLKIQPPCLLKRHGKMALESRIIVKGKQRLSRLRPLGAWLHGHSFSPRVTGSSLTDASTGSWL